jgi:hypothetical protein
MERYVTEPHIDESYFSREYKENTGVLRRCVTIFEIFKHSLNKIGWGRINASNFFIHLIPDAS